jgi:hypothetical protein
MPAFLSYLNCITNHSLKNLLNLFRRLSSQAHLPIFRRSHITQSLPLFPRSRPSLFLFHWPHHPVTSPSCRGRPRAPARPRSSVPRACPIFSFLIFCSNPFYLSLLTFSQTLFFFLFFCFVLASSFFFSPVLPTACSSCSPLLARTRGPAHDPPLPPLLAVHTHHPARVTPRLPRPLLLAVPLRACCPCTPSRCAACCCAGPSPSRPLALAACALSPSIPTAINGEAPVLPMTLPCRPSPLFLSAYKSDPKPPLTPPTPPQHLPSTSHCSSPLPLTIAGHHPSPWTALRRPSPHEVRAGIGPPRPPLHFSLLPGCCHAPGGRCPWPGRPPPTVPPSCSVSRKKNGRLVHNPFHFSSLCSPQPSISCDIMFRVNSKLHHASNILSKSQDPHPTNIIVFSIFFNRSSLFPSFFSSSANFVFIL